MNPKKLAILFLLVCLTLSTAAFAAEKPNVILIYSDDQGTLDAGCYGSDDILTPNIDKLAKTGVRFTQMYAPSAICSASRAGLLTGRIPVRAGVPANVSSHRGNSGMPAEQVTIAEMLKDAGYATAHVGKWHLGYNKETMPNAQGFDYSYGHLGGCIDNYSHFFYWVPPNQHDLWRNGKEIWETGKYFPTRCAEETNEFITRNKEKPFFVYLALNVPHYPLQAKEEWRKKYLEIEPKKVNLLKEIDPEVWKKYYKDQRSVRSMYAAFISSMDDEIGKVVDHLEKLKLRDNTIVIFQSDHGHSQESRTFWGGGYTGVYRGAKACLFEGGIRVPSIVSCPGIIPEDKVRGQMVHGNDWLPTIAAFTGAKLPKVKLDGKNIKEVILKDAPSPHKTLYWSLGGQWSVRDGDWKLLGGIRDTSNKLPVTAKDKKLFLVNLAEDPGETKNLAEKNPDQVKKMLEIKKEWEQK